MAARPAAWSPLACARVAGLLYLAIFVCGLFAEFFVRIRLIVPGDAAATAANILASEGLYRLGLLGDLVVVLCEIGVIAIFYVLFRPVSQLLSLVAALARLAMTAVMSVNLLNHLAPLELLGGAGYLGVLPAEQLQALALQALNAHAAAYDVAMVFFAVHCLVLGYLLARSGYVPRLLGAALALAGLGYLVDSLTSLLLPAYGSAVELVLVVPVVAELALCLWLLVRGVSVRAWREPAFA